MQSLPPELQTAIEQKNWPVVERLGVSVIAKSPTHVPTLLALSAAAEAKKEIDVEQLYLSMAADVDPKNPEIQRRMAACLTRQHRYEEALAALDVVEKAIPGDEPAAKNRAFVLAQMNRRKNGFENFDPEFVAFAARQQQKKSKEASTKLAANATPPEVDRAKLQELELAISRIPSDPDLYLQLAKLLVSYGKDYEAERLLTKGKEATENEARVVTMLQDVTLQRLHSRVTAAEQTIKTDDSQTARDELAQARGERDRGEILIFTQRCRKDPTNLRLRYELAVRQLRANKFDDAARGFREVINEPTLTAPAALALGECTEEFEDLPQALEYYRQAARTAVEPSQWDIRADALFRAAKLAIRLKLSRQATRYLEEVLQVSPNHSGAHEILDELRSESSDHLRKQKS